jgi:hypothetical protein
MYAALTRIWQALGEQRKESTYVYELLPGYPFGEQLFYKTVYTRLTQNPYRP